jgi:UDP-N-acetylmuramoyl-L-alanyl-D-glutamate--2,6-diaminopimelate ligase
MKIKDLIKEDFSIVGDLDKEISGISFDSRNIKSGDIFFALRGEKVDGHIFIDEAINKGASSIVYQRGYVPLKIKNGHEQKARRQENNNVPSPPLKLKGEMGSYLSSVTWIGVNDCRDALAYISNKYYGEPSKDLTVIGITGTNGKTTTSYLIRAILEKSGNATGLIGTISYFIKNKKYEAYHTTPEAPVFQAMLRHMVEEGCRFAISEVSSHALSQNRVSYTKFKIAVFTNLTRDHLDFHKNMEEYFLAKKRLFTELLSEDGTAIINEDDIYGKRILAELKDSKKRVITYSLKNDSADICAINISTTFKGTKFTLKIGNDIFEDITSPLIGITNVYNMLSAIAVTIALNIPLPVIKAGLSDISGIKGRFENVDLGQDFLAIVDYAHTEDALERLIMTARRLIDSDGSFKNDRKIITIFGCGGNRDKGKRKVMGDIATRLSDFVIITSDNPRYEDPREIIKDVELGVTKDNYIVVPDRKTAVELAVNIASSGDILLLAGKGHEDYQEIRGIRYNFSDRNVLEAALKKKVCKK